MFRAFVHFFSQRDSPTGSLVLPICCLLAKFGLAHYFTGPAGGLLELSPSPQHVLCCSVLRRVCPCLAGSDGDLLPAIITSRCRIWNPKLPRVTSVDLTHPGVEQHVQVTLIVAGMPVK
jgi:hypothetical protein